MKTFDWEKPQRQPLAGLAIVFLNTFWEVLKRMWPFVLIMLLGNKPGRSNRYEIIALLFLAFTIISAVFRFFYFRFFIEEGRLIIKKGWLKKETQVIPLNKIQTVQIEQGPLHQVLNIVKLSIDTAGSQKTEATIDAMHKPMAEALRQQLLSQKETTSETETIQEAAIEPVFRLQDKDLAKLSISANHIETLFILLAFGVGVYENLKDINSDIFSNIGNFLPKGNLFPLLFLAVAILLITILVSTARIFFTFYNFSVIKTGSGFHIKSGLTHLKERLINFRKIQFVSWRANWIRKLLGMWMLEYHISGGDELKKNAKVQIPVTQTSFIPTLTQDYFPLPQITDQISIRIHPSYVWRRLLIAGLLPSFVIIPLLWLRWDAASLFFLLYPALVLIITRQTQKNFVYGHWKTLHILKKDGLVKSEL